MRRLLAAVLVLGCKPVASGVAPEATVELDVQGHRGARGLRPENTLPGFSLAAKLGVTTLELDLHLTKDDALVVWHDPMVGPDKCDVESPVRVRDATMAELRGITCGRNPEPERFAEQRAPDGEDFSLVSLDDVLALPSERPLRFNIELKRVAEEPGTIDDGFDGTKPATFERVLVETLRKHGVLDRAVVQSFDHRSLWAVRQLAPRLQLAALTEGEADLRELADRGAAIWSPYFQVLTPAKVAEAHGLGLRVIPWTVNEPTDIDAVLQLGVDGIISDRPDVVLARLAN